MWPKLFIIYKIVGPQEIYLPEVNPMPPHDTEHITFAK
jgi:hypothetical protein